MEIRTMLSLACLPETRFVNLSMSSGASATVLPLRRLFQPSSSSSDLPPGDGNSTAKNSDFTAAFKNDSPSAEPLSPGASSSAISFTRSTNSCRVTHRTTLVSRRQISEHRCIP
eukprot:6763378-Pyramimonas_sp.AAC.2